MKRSVCITTIMLFLCFPLIASGTATAWARHYRVVPYFGEPCPDRCRATRLHLCSACMGGTMTCSEQLVCSNNRAIVCGEESTVSVPCWSPRIRW